MKLISIIRFAFISSIVILISCNSQNTNNSNQSSKSEHTDLWAVPENPYLYKNSSQPIVHFNSAQTDANIFPMPEGDITITPEQVTTIPATVAIPGGVHKNYEDGTSVILASTNASIMKVRFDGGRFDKVDEIIIPGLEENFATEEVVGDLLKKLDANYMNEEATLSLLDEYMDKY